MLLSNVVEHRHLIYQLVKREIQQRYRGSQLGFIWSFLLPILMLLVYMFVFGIVMQMKWGVVNENPVQFGVVMFAGLLLHSLLAEVLTRSSGIISANTQYVKKVVFPLHLLPLVVVLSSVFHLCVGLAILLSAAVITGSVISWTVCLIPVVLLPFMMLMLGCAWLLAALCTFVRDLAQIVGVLVTVLLFLAPILYPLSSVPEKLQFYMIWFNPLTVIVEQLRAVALFGQIPNWLHLSVYMGVALVIMFIGRWFFEKTRGAFADVI